jgi:hypothetical protein
MYTFQPSIASTSKTIASPSHANVKTLPQHCYVIAIVIATPMPKHCYAIATAVWLVSATPSNDVSSPGVFLRSFEQLSSRCSFGDANVQNSAQTTAHLIACNQVIVKKWACVVTPIC